MSVLKCKMCGGTLKVSDDSGIAICEYCGTKQTVSKTNDDVLSNLYNRANNLRLKNEFDKALNIYEKIVEQDDSEAEAHWGIVLCKYGIEYVDDPLTGKKIPTCHRTSFDSIKTDIDFQAAIDYADPGQQLLYEEEARTIDRLQKDILNIAKSEKPFDVFICYKETDDDGKRTIDSVIANDIYYQLTQEGFKVFYAAITLEDKLGQEYEPYIFAALNSAKVMLVIGTKPEYFNAVWVKNEWSRYLSLMKKDRSKILIPCYRDMDAYDLPDEFAHLQAQDMSKIGFINDVIRGIRKIIPKIDSKKENRNGVIDKNQSQINISVDALIKRAFIFLEDSDFEAADKYFDKVLDQNPENAEAYFGKMLVDYKLRSKNELLTNKESFSDNRNYVKALRYADPAYKEDLKTLYDYWLINNRSREHYEKRIKELKRLLVLAVGTGINEVAEPILQFARNHKEEGGDELLDYMNSQLEMLKNERNDLKEAIYKTFHLDNNHNEYFKNRDLETEKERLSKELSQLSVFKQRRKKEIEDSISLISEAESYQKEEARLLIAEERLNRFSEILNAEINLSDVENINFSDLYKRIQAKKSIDFGGYEFKGKDYRFKWRILYEKGTNILVLLDRCLEEMQFHDGKKYADWGDSSIRDWLNSTFYEEAFSDAERQLIIKANVPYGEEEQDYSSDYLFLLSEKEIERFFPEENDRVAYMLTNENSICWWWLRTVNYKTKNAMYIDSVGRIRTEGRNMNALDNCVRPAMWISLKEPDSEY